MKVHLETMGCQMNRLDSELVTAALRAAGHEMTDDPKAADVLLYNTCSVRRQAENKVYSRLGAAGQRKQHYPEIIVGVLGCMAQREGDDLLTKYPHVNVICSPNRLAELPRLIDEAAAGQRGIAMDDPRVGTPSVRSPAVRRSSDEGASTAQDEDRLTAGLQTQDALTGELQTQASPSPGPSGHPLPSRERSIEALDLSRDVRGTTSNVSAFVRVMRGCDKFCSYCIVPFVRGKEVCRDPRHVVEEVRRLVDAGRSEITLLGQTVNSYRFADNGATTRFSDLLALVSAVAGVRRLRFVTSHPNDFGDDILQAMRDLKNICPYIHVPAQSGSDAMLKKMNRRYTRAAYDELVDRARAIVPGVVLAGDFIVGFSGETEADHEASADLIRRSGYKNSFIFKYSPRPGTAAARNLPDDVSMDDKRRRNNELLAVQEEVGLAHHRSYIGREALVLVEGPSPRAAKQKPAPAGQTQLIGRTPGDHVVVFNGPPSLKDQYVGVRIVDATALTLFGGA